MGLVHSLNHHLSQPEGSLALKGNNQPPARLASNVREAAHQEARSPMCAQNHRAVATVARRSYKRNTTLP